MIQRVSLTLKITIAFVVILMGTLAFLYVVFYNLFQERMLQSEKEKATLIAQTIEPMIGMNFYLNLNDEIIGLSEQTIKQNNLNSLQVIIHGREFYNLPYDEEKEHIHVAYPIKDPITNFEIGEINVSYKLDNFFQAFEGVKAKIIKYLALLALVFLFFAFVIRRLLKPLGQIAEKMKNYQLGNHIDFSSIRTEPETKAIVSAFEKMLANIREYTILLERYKYAVDESAIVSKTDAEGKITYVNEEFYRTSGYNEDEAVGQSHALIRHPDMHEQVFTDLWETLHEKKVWKGAIKNKNKNGKPYYLKETIVPIYDESGDTIEYIGIGHDITQIVEQQEQIARQTTDLTTGLPNRIKLEEDIKVFNSPKFALVSLDNFNMIKDYYGYEIGNYTLRETAEMLLNYMANKNVSVYSFTSGDFGLLVDETIDVPSFHKICADVIQKIDDYVVHTEDDSYNIQATAGLTYTKENTLSHASLALQHARKTQKLSLVYEDTNNLVDQYEKNILWTKKLKEALNDDRIVVYVQPIVDAKSLEANKYECLVRMIGDDGKVISPFFFLDIAKKSKLYNTLTQRVITSAFEVFSQLPDKSFSINFCVEDLVNKETMEFLKAKMSKYDMASRVVLEIVESEGIENFNEIIPLISELKSLGCQIAIDDFGTGYSNFSYLMQLNVDYIKIDGSLIKSIDHDENSQIISRTIMDFANQLEIQTVAEFIHNEEVMAYTQEMGIDYLQGFHLGEPMPIEELLKK